MALEVHGRNVVVTPHLTERLERGLRPALEDPSSSVERVTVRLEAPSGAAAPLCHIFVSLRPSGGVVVQDAAPSLASAIDAAVTRALAALRREARRRASRGPSPAYAAME